MNWDKDFFPRLVVGTEDSHPPGLLDTLPWYHVSVALFRMKCLVERNQAVYLRK